MTQKKAKALCLEMWRYLAKHPKVSDKGQLPLETWEKVRDCHDECPLCECFRPILQTNCNGCPLSLAGEECFDRGSAFHRWVCSVTKAVRKEAAERIVSIVEAWEPEGEIS
jgi:hypothetical protein